MGLTSPTSEGFRAAFRRPSFTFAEIAWRWAVGTTAALLLLFGAIEYLSTLPVTSGELFMLRTRQPYLVAQALAHILHGSATRVSLAAILAGLFLAILWIIASSVGRLITVRALFEYFGREIENNVLWNDLRNLARLNFLRVAVVLAAILGLAGTPIVAKLFSPAAHPRPVLAFLVFTLVTATVSCVAWILNLFFTLAGIFVVRDGETESAAIYAAVDFIREHAGAFSSVTTWVGLAHLGVLMIGSTVVGLPLMFLAVAPWRSVVLATMILGLIYFAVADWLYMARLAGYIAILEMPIDAMAVPTVPPTPVTPLATTIDRNELILGDLPTLA